MLGHAANSSSTGLEVCVDECDGMPYTISSPMLVAGSVFLLVSSLLRTLARRALAPSAPHIHLICGVSAPCKDSVSAPAYLPVSSVQSCLSGPCLVHSLTSA